MISRSANFLKHVIITDEIDTYGINSKTTNILNWENIKNVTKTHRLPKALESDIASILYTSGSTGKPKGVILSHRNLTCGAESVCAYLENHTNDKILAALPFSFDYGLNQLTTSFLCNATCVLMNYLLPRDILTVAEKLSITGLAGVPPIWNQLADLKWSNEIANSLRYITNSGGHMPQPLIKKLQAKLPKTKIFLMYGLTEAFRSTYLNPNLIDKKPDSIGKAIPNAEILVVRPDGSECDTNEPGELVHRGPHVAMGYWNNSEKTCERFKVDPQALSEITTQQLAVWSGDIVKKDKDGFLYFVSRADEMIKTSGYRVSPSEIEEVFNQSGLIKEVCAFGVPHPKLGAAIFVVLVSNQNNITESIKPILSKQLPNYMLPAHIESVDDIPKNANGKFDRSHLIHKFKDFFQNK